MYQKAWKDQPITENGQLTTQPTIGVFDSGFGGLTVLRALLSLLPNANYIYLGDTARLPYGSKSQETIARYAVSSARFLHEQGAELLVVACNTATALALEDIRHALPIPVIGVIEPGAKAAHQSKPSFRESSSPKPLPQESSFRPNPERAKRVEGGVEKSASLPLSAESPQNRLSVVEPPPISAKLQVLVLATAATVQSHAYSHALNALNLEAHEKACPLLVPLVEEGWINHPVTDEVLKIYLTEALAEAPAAQILLLGCTHYPLLGPAIRRTLANLNHPLTIIDSAQATAEAVAAHLNLTPQNKAPQHKAVILSGAAPQPHRDAAQSKDPETSGLTNTGRPIPPTRSPASAFYATDSVEKFQRLGSAFLGQPVIGVRHIDLPE